MLVEDVEVVVLVVAAPAQSLARRAAAVLRHVVAHVDEAQLLIAPNMFAGEHHPAMAFSIADARFLMMASPYWQLLLRQPGHAKWSRLHCMVTSGERLRERLGAISRRERLEER